MRSRTVRHPLLSPDQGVLAFNQRVLAQAQDWRVPLLERLRYLTIVSSNLDEFFEIRMADLKEGIKLGDDVTRAGKDARALAYASLAVRAHTLVAEKYRLLNQEVLPALADNGVHFLLEEGWTPAQRQWLHNYFLREMMPLLTPIGLDPAHPFPRVLNKSLNFILQLKGRDAFGRNSDVAIVQAPRLLPRVIQLPKGVARGKYDFVLLSAVLQAFVDALFQGMMVKNCYSFRVTRNSDLFLDEENKDMRAAIQGELPQRHFGDTVRLEVAQTCPPDLVEFLLSQFALDEQDLYRVDGPVNLVRLMLVPDLVDLPALKFKPFVPGLPQTLEKSTNFFATIRQGDVLLHHPFQSFNPVIDLLEQAAQDPNVVAIKQTVYRTGTDSVLMKYLIDAAMRGKEVTVVVELMARFDEEANLNWATKLEEVGAHVVYGVIGHKTHCKLLMVVRREGGKLNRYAHLATGNYHPRTARLYTDFGLITANDRICQDVSEVFKQLTGVGRTRKLNHIVLAPFTLHDVMMASVRRETRHARARKKAHLILKINSLRDPRLIKALYAASQAGVKIDLIVRGVCILQPGVPQLSENIRVRSIVGRFLEHSRVFYFYNDGEEDVFISSADWMERNFFSRIEACVPILDPKLKMRVIKEGLKAYLADNSQAWEMNADGNYRLRKPSGSVPNSAQKQLLALMSAAQGD